ncbi:MAG: hypothetical protein M0R51_17030 [Clostridia bacterium]|jgi:hypothetical protein|nr:hypothetical protein [Clostridia bacterium]
MNKKEFLDKYKCKAVHCPTEELANEFLKLAYDFGINWMSGDKATEFNSWYMHKQKTCYIIGIDNKLTFSDVDYFKSENIEIIEFGKEKTMKYKDLLKNKALLEKEVPAEILKMLGLKKKGFEYGERYCFIDTIGNIRCENWDNYEIDIYRLKHNNAFHTEEEAEFEFEKQEVLAELRQFAEENNGEIEWKNDRQGRWYIKFFLGSGGICFDFDSYKRTNEIYFTSEELAQQAVAKVGEERLKKYLFGVGV